MTQTWDPQITILLTKLSDPSCSIFPAWKDSFLNLLSVALELLDMHILINPHWATREMSQCEKKSTVVLGLKPHTLRLCFRCTTKQAIWLPLLHLVSFFTVYEPPVTWAPPRSVTSQLQSFVMARYPLTGSRVSLSASTREIGMHWKGATTAVSSWQSRLWKSWRGLWTASSDSWCQSTIPSLASSQAEALQTQSLLSGNCKRSI